MSDSTGTSNGSPRFTVVGGGLAGALMATFLGQDGYKVDVYERRPDPREAGVKGGRSINLALSTRGLTALDAAGLKQRILDIAIPMYGRQIHSPTGEQSFQPYGIKDDDAINSVSRGELNLALLNAGEETDNVTLHFSQRCDDVDLETGAVTFRNDSTGETTTVENTVVIGADGAFSAVRGRMQKTDRFDYSQTYLTTGYKELEIPPADGEGDARFRIRKNALHVWPRGQYMMIALPNLDGSFTVTCFWPFEGPHSFEAIRSDADIEPFFREHFADSVEHMPELVKVWNDNPTSSLVTVRCTPWHVGGHIALIGDAAHAVVPFYGQGINCGFEDALVLRDLIRQHGADRLDAAFAAYTQARKANADALADMCIDNLIEMRDSSGSALFRFRKRVEKTLAKLLPSTFRSQYHLVTFSNVPYAEAQRRGQAQKALINRLFVGVPLGLLALLIVIVALIANG